MLAEARGASRSSASQRSSKRKLISSGAGAMTSYLQNEPFL
jgi:hypothetical protein